MISSILDLIVSDLPERTVQMTSGCAYGEENALTEIGDGTEVTLVYGRYSANAVVRMRSGGECFHGSFELGAPLARQLRLTGDKRYKLVYDTERKTIRIGPSPLSAASAPIGSDTKLGASRLSIGYALLSRLGLPDDGRDHTLTLRHGGLSRRLAVRSPANLFEGGLNLHPDTVRALKLRTGKTYKLSYDQRIKELVVTPTGVGQGKGDANRSGGTNRSGGAHRSGGAQRSGSTSRSAGVNRSAGAKAANRSGGAKAANRSGGASDGHRSPGVPAFNPPAPAKNRSAGAARKRPAHPSIAREKTRKPVPLAAPRDDRRPTSRAAKPIRQKRSSSDPAPVFHAAKRGASGPVATPKPYMPKGRA